MIRETLVRLGDRWSGFTPTAVLSSLEKTQYWPQERLEALQVDHLRRLLRHAGATISYYRDLFHSIGFKPDAVRSLKDMQCLPILDKVTISSQADRFISSAAIHPLCWLRTSGSTGQPFRFVRTRLAQSYKIASRLRFRRWYGVERCDPGLLVGGIAPVASDWKAQWMSRLHYFATNRVSVHSSDLHGNGLEAAARLIDQYQVKYIMGYPTGICALADYLVGSGRKLSHYPQAIFTNSETLFNETRGGIRTAFGIEPRADYVATEGCIAHECPEGSLHVDMEEALVELVPGEPGSDLSEVVITYLHSFDFPFIRYRLGDIARWFAKPCPCGRGLVTIDAVIGRSTDAIQMPDGRRFTAANINMRIAHFPFIENVRQYQIVQIDRGCLELRLLDTPETGNDTAQLFAAALSKLLRPLEVTVVKMPELPREKNGKFRPVVGLPTKGETTRQ